MRQKQPKLYSLIFYSTRYSYLSDITDLGTVYNPSMNRFIMTVNNINRRIRILLKQKVQL